MYSISYSCRQALMCLYTERELYLVCTSGGGKPDQKHRLAFWAFVCRIVCVCFCVHVHVEGTLSHFGTLWLYLSSKVAQRCLAAVKDLTTSLRCSPYLDLVCPWRQSRAALWVRLSRHMYCTWGLMLCCLAFFKGEDTDCSMPNLSEAQYTIIDNLNFTFILRCTW